MAAVTVTDGLSVKKVIFLGGVSNHDFSLQELEEQYPKEFIFSLKEESDDLL